MPSITHVSVMAAGVTGKLAGQAILAALLLVTSTPSRAAGGPTEEPLVSGSSRNTPAASNLCVQARLWASDARAPFTADAVSAMGNGDVCVFAQGPDIAHFYGPPYSSPDLLQLLSETELPGVLTDTARRELGSAIWHHTLQRDGATALAFTEFVAAGRPVYVREFKCMKPGIRWDLIPHPSSVFVESPSVCGAWQQTISPGETFVHYPAILGTTCWAILSGTCRAEAGPAGKLSIHLEPGSGSVAIVSMNDYPAGVALTESVRDRGTACLLGPTRQWWHDFSERRLAASPSLRLLPEPDAESLDAVAVMMKSQCSSTGGALIGALLPMAYIRDLYGGSRGMLALGMFEEARNLLLFRLRKFQTFGNLHTAESIGTDSARHVHENDEVEGPAYVILQARDYIRATGDHAFGDRLWPMLDWCYNVQLKHLAGGMLPFNGDETYIAGGFFPRSGLLQGSADSTLAFITSGDWLVEWAVGQGRWNHAQAQRCREVLETARESYREHFLDGDRIWANAPEREALITPPRFRHGVCEARTPEHFGWVERNRHGRYVSPAAANHDLPEEHPPRTVIHSVSLLPVYLGSDILSLEETRTAVEGVLTAASTTTGYIPTVPGGSGFVGYDPGLLLLNLLYLQDDRADAAYERMMRTLDDVQYWNEYYAQDGTAGLCIRANMWASGINAEAAVAYLRARSRETGQGIGAE